jgi:hypothetical protein
MIAKRAIFNWFLLSCELIALAVFGMHDTELAENPLISHELNCMLEFVRPVHVICLTYFQLFRLPVHFTTMTAAARHARHSQDG